MNTKKIVNIAVLTAFSLILFLVENLFPPLFPFAPGTKLGLSNIILLFVIIKYDYKEGLIVLTARCLLSAIFTNFFALYYSLISGLISLTVMYLLYRLVFPKIGIVIISIAGSVIFNLMQLILGAILYRTVVFMYYIPWTMVVSIATGALVGLSVWLIVKYLPKKILYDNLEITNLNNTNESNTNDKGV